MSVLWEKLSGNTDYFAFKVTFHKDPNGGEGATAEEALSWGAFQVWVMGQNLCSHLEEGETVDSAHWYQLGLLEWLANHWDPLLHEEHLPARNAENHSWKSLYATRFPPPGLDEAEAQRWDASWYGWWSRHSLQSCREGGLFPDLYIRRWREEVEISWGESRLAGAPEGVRFTVPVGLARLRPFEVARPLYEVLNEATEYLRARLPESPRLEALQRVVRTIPKTKDEARLPWLAGLGETSEELVARWRNLCRRLKKMSAEAAEAVLSVERDDLVLNGSCHAALMFGSVAPMIDDADVLILAAKLVELHSLEGEPAAVADLVKETPVDGRAERGWEQGYRLAEELLDSLGVLDGAGEWVDVAALLDRLEIEQQDIKLGDSTIRAVAVAGDRHRPAVLVNTSNQSNARGAGRRFTLAHELCHLLYDRSYGRKLAMASGPWAPKDVEQRASAFAAMFLMPPLLVRRAMDTLATPVEGWEHIVALCRTLRTSPTATLEHLCNLGFVNEAVRNRIRAEMDQQMGD